jgi:hypothetical protein
MTLVRWLLNALRGRRQRWRHRRRRGHRTWAMTSGDSATLVDIAVRTDTPKEKKLIKERNGPQ